MTKGAHAVIVNDKNQILLIRRDDINMWSIPGGKVENGESIEAACAREVYEETGCSVKVKNLLHIYYRDIPLFKDLSYVFGCDVTVTGSVIDKKEVREVQWFSIKALPPQTTSWVKFIVGSTLAPNEGYPLVDIIKSYDVNEMLSYLKFKSKSILRAYLPVN